MRSLLRAVPSRIARAVGRSPRGRRHGAAIAVTAVCLLAASVGTASSATRPGDSSPRAEVDPALVVVLAGSPDDASISAIVVLRDQLKPATIRPIAGERRAAATVRSLRNHADRTQAGLRATLQRGLARGDVLAATRLWVLNAISVTAHPRFIEQLADRPDIAAIVPDNTIQAPLATAPGSAASAEPNIALVGAPAMWSLGFTGAGITIASLDTGVDATHPDVATQWRGNAGSWFDPYGQHATPTDLSGHGTQTMGIIVGRSAGGSAIGVAPDATWIAAKIFNDSGTATSTAIHLAYQWALDPDGDPSTPDTPMVVNNSWTFGAPGCNMAFEPDLAALMAAGITPVFAAGNFGPSSNTSASPANNPDAFAVGAVDNDDATSALSSRGPTSCGRPVAATYPALAAPGVNVRTSDRGALYTTATGTSLAAPHVTGAIALLRQAFPGATPVAIRDALQASARDLGSAGADNVYGAGRVDLAGAYARLSGGTPSPTPTPTPGPTATPSPTPTTTPAPTPTPGPTAPPAPTVAPTPGDLAGPITGVPALGPNPATGSDPVTIGAVVDDGTTGGSNVTAAEWFVDVAGAPGSGHAMSGGFGGVTATIAGSIPAADLAALAGGSHAVLVRARDARGNWGPLASSSLVIDRSGPTASGGGVTPSPTQGSATATLAGTLTDATSSVVAGEWFIGPDPGPGLATPLVPADGAFDSPSESVRASVATAGRPFGELLVSFRGRDAAGTWGPLSTSAFLVTPPDGVFSDGFESGAGDRWTSRTGGTRLAFTNPAAMAGRYGMSVAISNGTAAYLTDTSPSALTSYHARFGFDGRGLVTSGRVIDILAGLNGRGDSILALEYRRDAGAAAQLRVGALRGRGMTWSAWTTLADGRHMLELAWLAASNGSVGLAIDGQASVGTGAIDTRGTALETVRLGPSAGLAKSMAGELQFDRFVSTRGSVIGP
jgi:serine protease AprX